MAEISADNLVSLELAGLYLEQGRTADVKRLMRQMEPVFRDQGVHAEARKALALFRRAQGDPRLRFEEAV
jgi:hypothetical protein